MKRTLAKSKSNKMIFGVCGGIGEYFGIDPTLIRLAFVLLAFLNGIGIVIYIILVVIMPSESGVEMGKE
ncbi:TPA: PspC domain-containing protein [Methanosarcinaceae archaeon]|nr:PspC domain-containing protein [Methanosarcinaceae archaeon]